MNRKELKQKALVSFKKNYWLCIGVFFAYTAIIGILSATVIGSIGVLILSGPFFGGLIVFMLNLTRKNEASLNDLFSGFNRFGQYLGTFLLQALFTFLWSFLFIIPGIIKGLAYSQAMYIAHDNPEMSASEALQKSQEMMKGHKWDLFILELSFIGWQILSIFTFGILNIFYITPYQNLTFTEYYEYLKSQTENVTINEADN